MSTSRRAFIGAGAATAAHVWIPKPVKGYTAAEIMTPVTPMKAGIMKSELDTPALCVDLDKLERNIAKMQRSANANKIGVRPHAKTHKCGAIAKLQMAAGALGICAAKLSEAEALARRRPGSRADDDQQSAAGQDSPRDAIEEALPGIRPGG